MYVFVANDCLVLVGYDVSDKNMLNLLPPSTTQKKSVVFVKIYKVSCPKRKNYS
jgi:hypothetical protein